MYDLSVTLHVLAALVGFGVTYSYPVLQLLGERGDRTHLPFALDAITTLSRWVAVPATAVVGVTGIYQLADGPYGLGDAWASAGLVLYLVVMAVAAGYAGALAMLAVVIGYRAIELWTVALAASVALVLLAVLVGPPLRKL